MRSTGLVEWLCKKAGDRGKELERKNSFALIITVLSILFGFTMSMLYPDYVSPIWVIVMLSAALAYGSLSPLVSARGLFFLAGSVPHTALLAAGVGILLSNWVGGGELYWALVTGLLVIYIVGYIIHKGFDPNRATAIFVGSIASLTVLVLYYVSTHFFLSTSISSIIVGDPLLASEREALTSLVIAVVTLSMVLLSYNEHVYIGVAKEHARLSGIKTWIYDLVFYSFLAITSVGLLKIVGFILTHVFILLPGSIGTVLSRGSKEVLYISLALSSFASIMGLFLSVFTNLSPSGTTGIIMVLLYIFAIMKKRGTG